MDRLPSSEFRKTFARLTRPVVVTVRDHPIGTWTPAPAPAREATHEAPTSAPEPVVAAPKAHPATVARGQARRDEWLRKLNG